MEKQNPWPYLAIVGIVAIVAVVILVLNSSDSNSEDSVLVVDEEGNIAGEAYRGGFARVVSSTGDSGTGDKGTMLGKPKDCCANYPKGCNGDGWCTKNCGTCP